MNSDLIIREYDRRDQKAVADLNQFTLEAAGVRSPDAPPDAGVDNIEAEYVDSGGAFLVGQSDGQIVAMGGIQKTDHDTAKVRRMRVHPDYQRCGFGTAVLNRLEARASKLGFTRLWLDTNVRLVPAQEFYARHGYRRTHVEVTGNDKLIYFEKRLPPPL
jgi:GNAT superfamily N-acetyltransferase